HAKIAGRDDVELATQPPRRTSIISNSNDGRNAYGIAFPCGKQCLEKSMPAAKASDSNRRSTQHSPQVLKSSAHSTVSGRAGNGKISLLGNQQAHDIASHRVLPSIDVTVQDVDVKVSALTQTTNNFFGHCHRAVMATGASNANRYEILALMAVSIQHGFQHDQEILNKGFCSILA